MNFVAHQLDKVNLRGFLEEKMQSADHEIVKRAEGTKEVRATSNEVYKLLDDGADIERKGLSRISGVTNTASDKQNRYEVARKLRSIDSFAFPEVINTETYDGDQRVEVEKIEGRDIFDTAIDNPDIAFDIGLKFGRYLSKAHEEDISPLDNATGNYLYEESWLNDGGEIYFVDPEYLTDDASLAHKLYDCLFFYSQSSSVDAPEQLINGFEAGYGIGTIESEIYRYVGKSASSRGKLTRVENTISSESDRSLNVTGD